jgi:hypothetical protein
MPNNKSDKNQQMASQRTGAPLSHIETQANKQMQNPVIPDDYENTSYSIPKVTAAIIILILIIALPVYFFWPKSADCGQDKVCFIDKANNCGKAAVRETIGTGTIITYATNNCVLTKSVETFAGDEPEDVVTFFKGKSMSCEYEKGSFDSILVDGISTGIDLCEGDLKDAILELRLAQISLE